MSKLSNEMLAALNSANNSLVDLKNGLLAVKSTPIKDNYHMAQVLFKLRNGLNDEVERIEKLLRGETNG